MKEKIRVIVGIFIAGLFILGLILYSTQYSLCQADINDIESYYGIQNGFNHFERIPYYDSDLAESGKLLYIHELIVSNEQYGDGICYYIDHIFTPHDVQFAGTFHIGETLPVKIKDNNWLYNDNKLDMLPSLLLLGAFSSILFICYSNKEN